MITDPTPSMPAQPYPASLSIEYPDRKLNRLTSFFRIFTVIPIVIILALISGGGNGRFNDTSITISGGAGILFLATALMILFRKKYPRWWFDWHLALTRFSARVFTYLLLMRDEYPSTDEEQAVHLDMVYPDAQKELGRGWPLIKWFLAITHYIILFLLGIAAFVIWILAWFAILFTGRYPRGMFEFNVGVLRWGLRVEAYALLLITDKYPAFSMEA